jgi:hypothetical protein
MSNQRRERGHGSSARSIVNIVSAALFIGAVAICIVPTLITSAILSSFWIEGENRTRGVTHRITIRGGGLLFLLICFFAGCLTYGFLGGLRFTLLSIAVFVVSYATGFIPVLGPVLYWFLLKDWVFQGLQIVGLNATWLTTVLMWFGLVVSIGMNGRCYFYKKVWKSFERRMDKFCRRADEFCTQHIPVIFTHWDRDNLGALAEQSHRYGVNRAALQEEISLFQRTLDSLELYKAELGNIRFRDGKSCMALERVVDIHSDIGESDYTGCFIYRVEFEKRSAQITVNLVGNDERVALLGLFFGTNEPIEISFDGSSEVGRGLERWISQQNR